MVFYTDMSFILNSNQILPFQVAPQGGSSISGYLDSNSSCRTWHRGWEGGLLTCSIALLQSRVRTKAQTGQVAVYKTFSVELRDSHHLKTAATWPVFIRERWCKSITPDTQDVLLQNSDSPKFSAAKPIVVLQERLRSTSINNKVSNQISVAQITPKGEEGMKEHAHFF